jgi:hypothetical protein
MGVPWRDVHAPSDLIVVTSPALDLPPELFGDLPFGWPLHAARRSHVKRMFAPPGQNACRNQLIIKVDGIEMGRARKRDRCDSARSSGGSPQPQRARSFS